MYTDNSSSDNWPKTLLIRNSFGGLIWQVYHVQKESEATKLSSNAAKNGFQHRELIDYDPEYKEIWPDWRETCSPDIIE